MKKLTYFIAFMSLLSTLTSCTADELEPEKKSVQTAAYAKDGDNDITPPPPPTPIKQ
jgi:hypothetical protein